MNFTQALELDCARLGITETEVARRMEISQQAVSKWKHRGFPTLYRMDELVKALGGSGEVANLDRVELHALASAYKAKQLAERKLKPAAATARTKARAAQGDSTELIVKVKKAPGTPSPNVAATLLELAAQRVLRGLAISATVVLALVTDIAPDDMDEEYKRNVKHAQALGVEVWHCRDDLELSRRVAERKGIEMNFEEA